MNLPSTAHESPASKASPASPLPPDGLIIIPVRNLVLFPGHVVPITIGRPGSVAAAQQALRDQRQVGIVMQRSPEVAEPAPADMHRLGTAANIVRYVTGPDGTNHLICQGEQRFQILEFYPGWPFLVARVLRIPEPDARSPEIEARFLHLKAQATEAMQLMPQAPEDLLGAIQAVTSPATLADLTTAYMDLQPEEKQEILETIDISARMEKVSRMLAHRIEILRLSQEIGRQTKAALDERQREVLLREQMAAIQRQLGEGEGAKAEETAELTEAIAKASMPKEVEELQTFYDGPIGIREPLYLFTSRVFSFEEISAAGAYGKLSVFYTAVAVAPSKSIDEHVQTASEGVDDCPHLGIENARGHFDIAEANELLSHFRVRFFGNKSRAEVFELGYGPIN